MKILCNLNLFALDQTIYLLKDDGSVEAIAQAEMEQLPEVISAICSEYDTRKVVLNGSVAFAQTIAEDITTFSAKNYNNNTIQVEVI